MVKKREKTWHGSSILDSSVHGNSHALERPHVVVGFRTLMGKFPGRPYFAVIDMGGFWLGHLAMIRENELVSSSKN